MVRGDEVMPPPCNGPDVVTRGERGNALAISLIHLFEEVILSLKMVIKVGITL